MPCRTFHPDPLALVQRTGACGPNVAGHLARAAVISRTAATAILRATTDRHRLMPARPPGRIPEVNAKPPHQSATPDGSGMHPRPGADTA